MISKRNVALAGAVLGLALVAAPVTGAQAASHPKKVVCTVSGGQAYVMRLPETLRRGPLYRELAADPTKVVKLARLMATSPEAGELVRMVATDRGAARFVGHADDEGGLDDFAQEVVTDAHGQPAGAVRAAKLVSRSDEAGEAAQLIDDDEGLARAARILVSRAEVRGAPDAGRIQTCELA